MTLPDNGGNRVTINTLWDKLDRVEERISARIAVSESRLNEKVDDLKNDLNRRMDGYDKQVDTLKTWDRVTAGIGAVFGPAIAFLISSFKREP